MDAMMLVREWKRMCRSSKTCLSCSIGKSAGVSTVCSNVVKEEPEKYVAIVEKWSAEHPKETRQSKFLKMFPNAELDDNGTISICPLFIEPNMECRLCSKTSCDKCRKKYWLEEVE